MIPRPSTTEGLVLTSTSLPADTEDAVFYGYRIPRQPLELVVWLLDKREILVVLDLDHTLLASHTIGDLKRLKAELHKRCAAVSCWSTRPPVRCTGGDQVVNYTHIT